NALPEFVVRHEFHGASPRRGGLRFAILDERCRSCTRPYMLRLMAARMARGEPSDGECGNLHSRRTGWKPGAVVEGCHSILRCPVSTDNPGRTSHFRQVGTSSSVASRRLSMNSSLIPAADR